MTTEANENNGTPIEGEQPTAVQQEALAQGWVPKDEFEGDEERWVDAGEFVRRGELFRKIESQSKELKDVKKALNELAKHNAKVREVEYARAIDALKAEKKTALSEGDADRVVDLDDKIDLVKDQQKQLQTETVQEAMNVTQDVHPELKNWINKNPWYDNSLEMRAWADGRGVELSREGKSPFQVLQALETEVKNRFKEKFRNPNREKAGAVEGVSNRQGGSSKAEMELSDVEKTVMKTLVDGGHITKEEYLKQLKAVKGN
jgi:hypothetical protein